jgi:hypothetical protein
LEELLNAQHHRAAADALVPRDGFITLAGCRIQKKRGPLSAALFVASRLTNELQDAPFLLAELEGLPFPREGHTPLKQKWVKMYSYLENVNLVR